jgi:hypothetical protein
VWFWLWSSLVAAWLAGVFFGLRWLWRRFAELTRAVAEAAALVGQVAQDRQTSFEATPIPTPAMVADPAELAARALARGDRKAARRRRKQERHQAVYDDWAVLAGYKDA